MLGPFLEWRWFQGGFVKVVADVFVGFKFLIKFAIYVIIHCGLVSSKKHKTSTAAWQNQNAKSPYRDVNIHGRTHVTQMRQGVVSY